MTKLASSCLNQLKTLFVEETDVRSSAVITSQTMNDLEC